jgi:peptidoglycan/xylan/chitin deacetylase (PgdA/CDA1 family)
VATAEIGDVLFANDAPAVFFVAGQAVKGNEAVLATLKERGHLIANHTYSEVPLTTAPSPVAEVAKTDELIAPYVSGEVFLLRAPAGAFDASVARRLNDAGLAKYVGPVQWDIGGQELSDAACWQEGMSASACAEIYLDAIRAADRGIVRFSAEPEETAQMLRVLLPKLKSEGYRFMRIDAMPAVAASLERGGAAPGTVGGNGGCRGY